MAIPRISSYDLTSACTPITNRVDWKINPSRAVLLVHDMQNYFVDFYDRTQAPIKNVIHNCQTLINKSENSGITAIYTAQPPNQTPQDRALLTDFWGPGLSEDNTQSSEPKATGIINELSPSASALQFTKWRYSAFQRTPLEQWMRDNNKDQLIICGVYAHIGILSTCLEGFMRDIQCFVIEDACADFSGEEHKMARQYIAGRCGAVIPLSEVLTSIQPSTANATKVQQKDSAIQNQHAVFSPAQLQRQIAQALQIHPDDFEASDNLMDVGLDSIRLMSLLDQWRNAGANVDFIDLADTPTVNDWSSLLSASAQPAATETA